ncbi:hypothetical protein ABK040_007864 [Willaertia magna]
MINNQISLSEQNDDYIINHTLDENNNFNVIDIHTVSTGDDDFMDLIDYSSVMLIKEEFVTNTEINYVPPPLGASLRDPKNKTKDIIIKTVDNNTSEDISIPSSSSKKDLIEEKQTIIEMNIKLYKDFMRKEENEDLESTLEIQFLRILLDFLSENNILQSTVPIWRNIPIDLFNLYRHVVHLGGYNEMNENKWKIVFGRIKNYNSIVTNPVNRLKVLYEYYLKDFENSKEAKIIDKYLLEDIEEEIEDEVERKKDFEEYQNYLMRKIKQVQLKEFIMSNALNNNYSSSSDYKSDTKEKVNNKKKEEKKEIKITKHSLSNMQKEITIAHLEIFKVDKSNVITVQIEIYHTPTGKVILNSLPLEGDIQSFGHLIYSSVILTNNNEKDIKTEYSLNSVDKIENGTLCYWSSGGDNIIFGYGKTPVSKKNECRLTDKCIIFGKLNDSKYTCNLKQVNNDIIYLPNLLSSLESDEGVGWSMKLSIYNEIIIPNSPTRKRRKRNVNNGTFEEDDSTPTTINNLKTFVVKYKYEGELDNDSRLITHEFENVNIVDQNQLFNVLKKDNVPLSTLSEIRYYREGKDEIHSGWILKHSLD